MAPAPTECARDPRTADAATLVLGSGGASRGRADTDATVEMTRELWRRIDRPNLFVKIPATAEGVPAIRQAVSEGINVNVTLIFGLDRYASVIERSTPSTRSISRR